MYNLITHGILMSRNNNIKELIDVRQTNKSWKEEKKKRMGKWIETKEVKNKEILWKER